MATLYISEFNEIGGSGDEFHQIAKVPAVVQQTPVTITTSSAQSAAFAGSTRFVRVVSDTACWVLFGANPTATTSSMYLPAGSIEYFSVTAAHKVAVIGV